MLNDNLTTLGDIMLAVKKKVDDVERSVKTTSGEVRQVQKVINQVNEQNTPREMNSFRLLVASVAIASVGIVVSILTLFK